MPTKSNLSLAKIEKIIGKKPWLGDYLWAIREADEITQGDFAKILGVSRQYLCDVEKGRRIISAKTAADFAQKLGYLCDLFVLLALQDELRQAGLKYDVTLTRHKDAA